MLFTIFLKHLRISGHYWIIHRESFSSLCVHIFFYAVTYSGRMSSNPKFAADFSTLCHFCTVSLTWCIDPLCIWVELEILRSYVTLKKLGSLAVKILLHLGESKITVIAVHTLIFLIRLFQITMRIFVYIYLYITWAF